MTFRLFLKILFYFPGTYLHEMAHYLLAKLTLSEVNSFTVIPRVKDGDIWYGSVNATPRAKVLFTLIAMAPLLWWFVLAYISLYIGFIQIEIFEEGTIAFYVTPEVLLNKYILVSTYIALQLIRAGGLSKQDVLMILKGILSRSGGVVFLVCLIIYVLNN